MKTKYFLLKTFAITLFLTYNSWSQATIAQWNFNGTSATTIPGGETSPTVSVGSGTAQLIGGTTATFAAGNATVGTMETETTNLPPNFAWNTTNYAPLGTDNKARGVQFNVSTVNQAGITFRFEQRLSNTSNNTYVVQYTANRTAAVSSWTDAQTFTFTPDATTTGDTWYNARIVDLASITALDNNPNVAFRVVSAFDPTTNDYRASRSTSTYAGGNVRFDLVSVKSNLTLGVSQFDETANNFIIYPNPANNGIVHFNKPRDIQIFDVLGKNILSAKNTSTVDTNTFKAGTYFIKTNGITKKLLVR